MKFSSWFSVSLFSLGTLGILSNVFTGLVLTKNSASESDIHLSIALCSIAFLVVGSLWQIRLSRLSLDAVQEKIVFSKSKEITNLNKLATFRNRAVSYSIFVIVCCVINIVSGTVSQTGRFPLVHGLFGFVLVGLAISTLIFWIRLFWALKNAGRSLI